MSTDRSICAYICGIYKVKFTQVEGGVYQGWRDWGNGEILVKKYKVAAM